MKFFVYFFAAVCLLFYTNCFAQNGKTIFGKKSFLFVGGQFNVPIYSGSFKPVNNIRKGDKIVQKRRLFDTGFDLSFNHNVRSNISVGFAFKYHTLTVPSGSSYKVHYGTPSHLNTDTFDFMLTSPKMYSMSFVPFVEISNLKNGSPIGIINQLGVGYSITKFTKQEYDYVMKRKSSSVWFSPDVFDFNPESPSYKSVTLMYGQLLKLPLTKRLLIGAGIKYYLNFYLKNEAHKSAYKMIDYYDTYFYLKEKRLLSIQANISLGYSF